MDFIGAIKACLKKYATFKGRAARPEFWYWALFTWLLSMAAYTIDSALSGTADPMARSMAVSNLVILATVLPTVGVSIRRLHDVGRSGWWFLLVFTGIGALLLLFWYLRPGKPTGRSGSA